MQVDGIQLRSRSTMFWRLVSVIVLPALILFMILLALHAAVPRPVRGAWASPGDPTETPTPQLELDKRGPEVIIPGQPVIYTLTLSCTNEATATGVVVADIFPTEVISPLSASLPFTQDGDRLSWDVGTLGPFTEPKVIILTGTANLPLPDGLIVTNVASLEANIPTLLEAVWRSRVSSRPELTVSLQASRRYAIPGSTLVFTAWCTNTGTAVATGTGLAHHLPTSVDYVSAHPLPVVTPAAESQDVVWDLGTLEVTGTFVVMTATVRSDAEDAVVSHRVQLDCQETDAVSDSLNVTIHQPVLYMPIIMAGYCPPLTNGGFEEGIQGWTYLVSGPDVEAPALECGTGITPYEQCAMRIGACNSPCGGAIEPGTSGVSQWALIPSRSCTLTLHYRVMSYENELGVGRDRFAVVTGKQVSVVPVNPDDREGFRCQLPVWDSGWQSYEVYSWGEEVPGCIEIALQAYNVDSWYDTCVYVDKVEITCP